MDTLYLIDKAINGPWLKSLMDNDERNAFNTDNIRIYHKYGSYDKNFHGIGLNLTNNNPYAILIFTRHERSNYEEVIQNIHSKIMDLHETFWEQRKVICYIKAYG